MNCHRKLLSIMKNEQKISNYLKSFVAEIFRLHQTNFLSNISGYNVKEVFQNIAN